MLLHDVEYVNEQNIKSTVQRMLKDLSQVVPDKPPKSSTEKEPEKSPRKKTVFDQLGSLVKRSKSMDIK